MALPDNFLSNLVETVEDAGVMTERLRICQLILARAERQDTTTNYGRVVVSELKALYEQIAEPVPDTPESAA